MNVQVNLIRPNELRSASMVSLKSLGLIAAIVVPLVMVLGMGWNYMGYLEVRSALRNLEEQSTQSERQKKDVQVVSKNLAFQTKLHDEVMGWGQSRVAWGEMLGGMQGRVPDTMQWRSLQMIMQTLVMKDGQLVREHTLAVNGRCQGPGADQQVEALRHAWATEEPMAKWVARADVALFGEDDTPGASKEDRIFQIEVKCHPGEFHASAGQ